MFVFLISVLDGGEWLDSRSCRFTHSGNSPRNIVSRRLDGAQSIYRNFLVQDG
jgi:hypothetical protein